MANLRDKIQKTLEPKIWDENPLRVIGFSYQILNLGLSDDQLYEYCRKSSLYLVQMLHPDKVGDGYQAAHTKFFSAFNLLDDREVFDKALKEFAGEKTDERQDVTLLRESVELLKKQKKDLDTELRSKEKLYYQNQEDNKLLSQRISDIFKTSSNTFLVHDEDGAIIRSSLGVAKFLNVLNFKINFCEEPDHGQLKRATQRYKALIVKAKSCSRDYDSLLEPAKLKQYCSENGLLNAPNEFLKNISDSKLFLPVVWNQITACKHLGFDLLVQGFKQDPLAHQINKTNLPPGVLARYYSQCIGKLHYLFKDWSVKSKSLGIEEIQLSVKTISLDDDYVLTLNGKNKTQIKIVGSVPIHYVDQSSLNSVNNLFSFNRGWVYRNMQSFIDVGSFLIASTPHSYRLPEQYMNSRKMFDKVDPDKESFISGDIVLEILI